MVKKYYPVLQGGFIWEWVEHGIETFDEQGRKYWSYGGDLGGHRWTHDGNFCADGIVSADRSTHPGIQEIKKMYQPIWMKAIDIEKGKISMNNHHLFTDLNVYDYKWELYKNGELVQTNTLNISGGPLSETELTIPLPSLQYAAGDEYFVRIKAFTRKATDLIPAGHLVAEEEFPFPKNNFFVKASSQGNLKTEETERKGRFSTEKLLQFESGDVKGSISLSSGQLIGYSYKGKQLITSAPVPNFWRGPTDNDFGYNQQIKGNVWRTADTDLTVENVDVKAQTDEGVEVIVTKKLKYVDASYTTSYLIRNDGSVKVTASVDFKGKDHPEPSRFGMKMQLPVNFTNVQYYGRGPWENYNDRNNSAFVGKYDCKVVDLGFTYTRPQENGYRTDVRFVSFTDDNGSGIVFEGYDQPICFNARYNADEDFDPGLTKKQQHSIDIDPQNILFVNIDLKQLGLSGDNSWGALPLAQYRMLDDSYTYSYVIRPAQ